MVNYPTTVATSDIPSFSGVMEFAQWYFTAGRPMNVPKDAEAFTTDDAMSYSLFRHGRFQAELYFIQPQPIIPVHEHPGVKAIEIHSNFWGAIDDDLLKQRLLDDGMSHGNEIRYLSEKTGFMILSLQEWLPELLVSTIGSRWKGHTAGPIHDRLIRRFNPNCFAYDGYADVTRNKAAAVL